MKGDKHVGGASGGDEQDGAAGRRRGAAATLADGQRPGGRRAAAAGKGAWWRQPAALRAGREPGECFNSDFCPKSAAHSHVARASACLLGRERPFQSAQRSLQSAPCGLARIERRRSVSHSHAAPAADLRNTGVAVHFLENCIAWAYNSWDLHAARQGHVLRNGKLTCGGKDK